MGILLMLEDRSGRLWLTTLGGVHRYDGGAATEGQSGGDSASFTAFTTADGLADGRVTCLLEDRAGYLWFGRAQYGVTRYDGKE
jgi:ligand-binding sensor domain-containing protein